MKKYLTIILLFFAFIVKAQMQPDTIPQYDFMFIVGDTNDFRKAERLVYNALVTEDRMHAITWCDITKDTTTNTYACEVPTPIRISKISEVSPIIPYIAEILEHPDQLGYWKSEMLKLDIPTEWKWLVGKLYIVNRKKYKRL